MIFMHFVNHYYSVVMFLNDDIDWILEQLIKMHGEQMKSLLGRCWPV
jgi:hypothetical protein